MKWAVIVARVFLGAFLIFNGINLWFPFLPIPRPASQEANDLMHGLVFSGLFQFVKIIEIVSGLMLLLNRFVPLALVLMLPLTLVIAWVDFVLIRSPNSFVFGALLMVPHVFLLFAYLRHYLSMLAMKADPGIPSGVEIMGAVLKEGSTRAAS